MRRRSGYGGDMTEVPVRELRNNTSALIRRVQAGERVVVTVNGQPTVGLVPVRESSGRWMPRADLVRRLRVASADPGLRDDLHRLAGETTDDLPPLA